MKKLIARLLFYPVTWLFVEILEELKGEVYPKYYAKKLRQGKWILKHENKFNFWDWVAEDMPWGF